MKKKITPIIILALRVQQIRTNVNDLQLTICRTKNKNATGERKKISKKDSYARIF